MKTRVKIWCLLFFVQKAGGKLHISVISLGHQRESAVVQLYERTYACRPPWGRKGVECSIFSRLSECKLTLILLLNFTGYQWSKCHKTIRADDWEVAEGITAECHFIRWRGKRKGYIQGHLFRNKSLAQASWVRDLWTPFPRSGQRQLKLGCSKPALGSPSWPMLALLSQMQPGICTDISKNAPSFLQQSVAFIQQVLLIW